MKKSIMELILTVSILYPAYPQNNLKEIINEYDEVCFCNVGLAHPLTILNLDNNAEILFTLKGGKTLNELKHSGIYFTKSQIYLLKSTGMIRKTDSLYRPAVPVISREHTLNIRKETRKIAREIIPLFSDEYNIYMNTLDQEGLKSNGYTLFFALILDGLVWSALMDNNDVEPRNISSKKPFWNGTFWMLTPKRDFSCGTNSMSAGRFSINENWSEESDIGISDYYLFKELIKDFSINGKITNPEVIEEFKENELFNESGELQIPVIKADSADVVFSKAEKIAAIVAEYLSQKINYSTFLTDYPNLGRGQKITILYHEIMWDILDLMEENKQIVRPVAFDNSKKASAGDLKDLVFILER